jgi:hypothetical protein
MKQVWACLCVIGVWVGGGVGVAPANRRLQRRSLVPPRPDGRLGGLRNTLAKNGINLDVDLRCCCGSRPTAPAKGAHEMRMSRTVITRRGDDQRCW